MKLFILCNISQYFKVISSNIYSAHDKIIIIEDKLSQKQKENINKLQLEDNITYIKTSDIVKTKSESLGIFIFTYLFELPFFRFPRWLIYKKVERELDLDNYNEIIIPHETPPILAIILYYKNVSLLEDGKLNYRYATFSKKHELIRRFFRKKKEYIIGQHKNIKNIYATHPNLIPIEIIKTKKVKELTLIYNNKNKKNNDDDFDIILITQQISECGYCTIKEKHLLYNNIVDILKNEFNIKRIAIKYHPAEINIDYIRDTSVITIEKDLPFEAMSINKNSICLSLFSSTSHSNYIELININSIKEDLNKLINSKCHLSKLLHSSMKEKK